MLFITLLHFIMNLWPNLKPYLWQWNQESHSSPTSVDAVSISNGILHVLSTIFFFQTDYYLDLVTIWFRNQLPSRHFLYSLTISSLYQKENWKSFITSTEYQGVVISRYILAMNQVCDIDTELGLIKINQVRYNNQ